MFRDTEAVALALGLLAIRAYKFPVDVVAVEGALAKTERVMPQKLLNQVRGVQEAITLNVSAHGAQAVNEIVVTLSAAAQERIQVYLKYRSWNGEDTEREFDPYGIVFNDGYWYISGYCHLRKGLRTFRLDRVVDVDMREQTFERPKDFDTLEHVLRSIGQMPGTYEVEILLQTSLEHAREVIPAIMGTVEAQGDHILFKRRASILEWIPEILMQWDFPAVVRKPVELQEMMRQLACKALHLAGDSGESEVTGHPLSDSERR